MQLTFMLGKEVGYFFLYFLHFSVLLFFLLEAVMNNGIVKLHTKGMKRLHSCVKCFSTSESVQV